MTVLRIDLETVAPRSVLVVLTTDLHHSGEIHLVALGPLLIPLVVDILVVVVGVMAVATSVTVIETHETVTEIATFEITAMARRFAAIWTGTGFAATAILTPETTGVALVEVAQDHRRATFGT